MALDAYGAVEAVLEDGHVTEKERTVLATLADELDISSRDALALERDAERALAGAARCGRSLLTTTVNQTLHNP